MRQQPFGDTDQAAVVISLRLILESHRATGAGDAVEGRLARQQKIPPIANKRDRTFRWKILQLPVRSSPCGVSAGELRSSRTSIRKSSA